MNQIVVDAELLKRLENLDHVVELCDASGEVIATVTPRFDASDYISVGPEPTIEELRQIAGDPGETYTTAEILQHLRSLKCSQ